MRILGLFLGPVVGFAVFIIISNIAIHLDSDAEEGTKAGYSIGAIIAGIAAWRGTVSFFTSITIQ